MVRRRALMAGRHSIIAALACLVPMAIASGETAQGNDAAGYRITPEPEWADPIQWDPPESVPEDELEDGVYYFLVDETERAETSERFGQFARKIVNEFGVQNGAEIQITFDPAYQSIDLHRVDVWRDGKWQNRLAPSIITLLQREADMDRFVLDGSKTLVIRLPDIRPGDVIAYSFTRRGANPVMGGRLYSSFTTGSTTPWKILRQRIIANPDQPLEIRQHGTDLAHELNGDVYEWQAEDLPIVDAEESVPDWVSVYPWIEASSWGSWSDVVRWALPLYPRGQPLTDELDALVAEWSTLPEPSQRAAAALQFTQDQVRYLAVAGGIHSHQPRPPGEVAANRLGDCKEKVLLLMNLLDRLEIENHPVFVNTEWGRGIADFLPSPYAFDHVILQVVIDGESFFVDPTSTAQRGPLAQRSISHHYGLGLRAREGDESLIPVDPRPESKGTTRVVEHFVLGDTKNDRASTMRITTTHQGSNAVLTRRQFAESSLSQLQKQYLEFYSDRFPSIEAAEPIKFTDDPESNRFTVEESYVIPELWQPKSNNPNVLAARVYQDEFGNRLSWPSRTSRRWPYRLTFPVDFAIETRVDLPEPWPKSLKESTGGGRWFDFQYRREIKGSTAQLSGHYKSKATEVPPKEIADYRAEAEKAYDTIGYQFTSNTAFDQTFAVFKSWTPNYFLISLIAFTATVSAVGGIAVLRRDRSIPPVVPSPDDRHLDGLAGWLILVAIGLVMSPFSILAGLVQSTLPFLDAPTWRSLTESGGDSYHSAWGPVLVFSVVASILLLTISLVTAILFFQKRRRFPPVFIAFNLAHLLVVAIDFGLIHVIPISPDPEDTQPASELTSALVGCMIWIPYMLISKRVKATFRV